MTPETAYWLALSEHKMKVLDEWAQFRADPLAYQWVIEQIDEQLVAIADHDRVEFH